MDRVTRRQRIAVLVVIAVTMFVAAPVAAQQWGRVGGVLALCAGGVVAALSLLWLGRRGSG